MLKVNKVIEDKQGQECHQYDQLKNVHELMTMARICY